MSGTHVTNARLNLRLLGGFEARLATGQPLPLSSRKAQGLLAYLAAGAQRACPRETLATLLWARSGSDQARMSLRQTLTVLRKALSPMGAEVLVTERQQVSLVPDAVEVDVHELERRAAEGSTSALEHVIALYGGDLLEGFDLSSEPFEDWLMVQRTRLRGLAESAAARLLKIYGESGEREHALRVALRLAELNPLREDTQRTLMRLYAESGRPAQALTQYAQLCDALRRELDVDPADETRALAAELREQHTNRRPATAAVSAPVSNQPYPDAYRREHCAQPMGDGHPGDRSAFESQTSAPPGQGGSTIAERRYLTLVFCALVDPLAQASHHDPEEMQQATLAFRAFCKRAIDRFGGRVAQSMGNGLLAFFGYPAGEYSAERAARAGLQIVSRLGEASDRPTSGLQARIAIASGDVVVGSLTGDDVEVTGAAVNLVAELQRMVEPDHIVVAGEAKQALGGLFEYRDLGARKLAGLQVPVRVWSLVREATGPRRFETMHMAARLTPLVGRAEEVTSLLNLWQRARTGAGQVAVLSGEAGIGKSRLIRVLQETLAGEPHLTLSYFGSPYHRDSALFPVIKQLELAAEFRRDDTPATKLERLETLLARSTENAARAVPPLADLLSIPTRGSDPKSVATPERRREMTLETLEGLLESLSHKQPILVIFEDLHYVDPTTRELLDRLVERAQNLPVMVVVTHRPTFSFPWLFEAHVTNLVLRRLDRADSGTLARQVARGRTLSAELQARIVSSADGIPLFIEEVTKSVLEGGGDGEVPNAMDRAVAVPSSLQDPLLARIDRLGSAKAVAQAAAVIGRRFSYELLALIVPTHEETPSDALLKLMDAELVYARGTGTSATYRFKHGLVQEAIYATLLRADREGLHARVVRALEKRFAETAEKEPELLAHHCAGAGLKDEAVSYWQNAADQAIGRSAVAEAAGHLTKALDTLGTLPATAERAKQELSLQTQLGRVWILNKGYAAPEVESAYSRARELCEETGDRHQLFLVLLGLWQLYISRQHLERARGLGQQLLALAQSQNDVHFLLEAYVTQSITSHAEGAFVEALTQANRAIALYDPIQHRNHGARFGQDAGVISRIMAAWALWCLGYPDQALTRMREAQTLALDLDQPYSQAMADYCSAWLHQYRAEPKTTRKEAERAINLSTEQGFGWPLAFACILHGWALAEERRANEGITEINNGLAALRTMGAELWQPHLLGLLGTAHASADQAEEALSLFEEALDRLGMTGEREYAAELYRLKGELLVQVEGQVSAERAEACFRRAIEIAVEQQAKSWELRAATSLAALRCRLGKKEQAHGLLLPVYAWFTEGHASPDLKTAAALLGTLNPNTP